MPCDLFGSSGTGSSTPTVNVDSRSGAEAALAAYRASGTAVSTSSSSPQSSAVAGWCRLQWTSTLVRSRAYKRNLLRSSPRFPPRSHIMQAFIGATLLTSKEAQPQEKPFEISDCRLSGFMLRIQPSGVRTYYARFGRNRRVVIGKVDTISPEEARVRCQKILGNVAHGLHPLHGIQGTDGMTLGMFIADTYTTWVNASRPRTAANTLEKLYRLFRTWYAEPLTAITVERIESWKARRLNEGRSPATVLRDLFTLSSVLRRAVKAGELTENPVQRVDKPRIDRRGKVRFLDQAEESRLRAALKARDEELQNLRTSSNARRQYRHEKL